MSKRDLQSLWGHSYLDLQNKDPDTIIPQLLSKKVKFQNESIQREVHDLLVAYKLRNYGGHNIKQQNCLTHNFDDIIQSLFNSLFIAVELL
jgi:hypothetical protein